MPDKRTRLKEDLRCKTPEVRPRAVLIWPGITGLCFADALLDGRNDLGTQFGLVQQFHGSEAGARLAVSSLVQKDIAKMHEPERRDLKVSSWLKPGMCISIKTTAAFASLSLLIHSA
jgi:hypothetical protein